MTWRLGEALALAYKTLTPVAATHFLLTIIFLLIHLSHYHDPTSQPCNEKKKIHNLFSFETWVHIPWIYQLHTVWYSESSPVDCLNWLLLFLLKQLLKYQNQSLFKPVSVVFSSARLNPTLGLYCCSFSRSLSLFFFHILPPPPLICFLTAASGYLVVVAPGAVWLADCGRQLFGGEPIAAVAEVGHPCADRVISSEHTSVHWRAGYTAWHSCRRWKGQLLTHVDGQCKPHAREMWPATPGKHRDCRQVHCSLNSHIVMSTSACESSLFGRTCNVEFFQHFTQKIK